MRFALLLLAAAAAISVASAFGPSLLPEPARAPTASKPAAPTKPAARIAPSEPPALVLQAGVMFRAPQIPEKLAAAERAEREPQLVLAGILGRAGERKALVRYKESGRTQLAAPGALLGDWKLDALDDGCAALSKGKLRTKLCL